MAYHSSEYDLQLSVCKYLKLQYPNIIFRSDLAGIAMTKGMARKYAKIQHSSGFPDLFIYYPSKGFNGLALELKNTNIYKKDGTLKKNDHLQKQEKILNYLKRHKYCAAFAVGFDQAKKLIDSYILC
tara:strand:+ start:233 stop:613 length:381 start_codon:yes stop_codon:yes gene_type:complete